MKTPQRVLCVDDFSAQRGIIKRLLLEVGCQQILEADDGESALLLLAREPVDLIIADWRMSKIDGLNLLETLRNDESFNNVPFLMIAAESDRDHMPQAILAGANGFLIKPFKAEALKRKIGTLTIPD